MKLLQREKAPVKRDLKKVGKSKLQASSIQERSPFPMGVHLWRPNSPAVAVSLGGDEGGYVCTKIFVCGGGGGTPRTTYRRHVKAKVTPELFGI